MRNTVQNTVTLLAERKFSNETVSAGILAVHGLDDDDGVLKARLGYFVRGNVELTLGYDLFYGRRGGLFGQFNDNDRLSFHVEIGL